MFYWQRLFYTVVNYIEVQLLWKHETSVFPFQFSNSVKCLLLKCWDLQRRKLHLTQRARNVSKMFWTYLHLRPLDWVMSVFPKAPVHSFRVVFTIEVQTIQIGVVTTVVPPAAFITQSTVSTAVLVIITIFGGKWHATMIGKRVTSGSCKKKEQRNIGVIFLGYFGYLPLSLGIL